MAELLPQISSEFLSGGICQHCEALIPAFVKGNYCALCNGIQHPKKHVYEEDQTLPERKVRPTISRSRGRFAWLNEGPDSTPKPERGDGHVGETTHLSVKGHTTRMAQRVQAQVLRMSTEISQGKQEVLSAIKKMRDEEAAADRKARGEKMATLQKKDKVRHSIQHRNSLWADMLKESKQAKLSHMEKGESAANAPSFLQALAAANQVRRASIAVASPPAASDSDARAVQSEQPQAESGGAAGRGAKWAWGLVAQVVKSEPLLWSPPALQGSWSSLDVSHSTAYSPNLDHFSRRKEPAKGDSIDQVHEATTLAVLEQTRRKAHRTSLLAAKSREEIEAGKQECDAALKEIKDGRKRAEREASQEKLRKFKFQDKVRDVIQRRNSMWAGMLNQAKQEGRAGSPQRASFLQCLATATSETEPQSAAVAAAAFGMKRESSAPAL